MASNHNFRKLAIWNDSINFSLKIYAISQSFPSSEIYGLTSQIRRAAVSIPSNIAEGTSKSTDKHFVQYLQNAIGSSYEVETQLIIAYKIEYLNHENFEELKNELNKIQSMIAKFINSLTS